MATNLLKYGAAEATFGMRNAGDLPFDSHPLIAHCAPRPTFISYGIPESGAANCLNQRGKFMTAIAAASVIGRRKAKVFGKSDDRTTEQLPKVNEKLLDGVLAWRQHDGGRTDTPNRQHFDEWANRSYSQIKGRLEFACRK